MGRLEGASLEVLVLFLSRRKAMGWVMVCK
jgi:hypothetical protein